MSDKKVNKIINYFENISGVVSNKNDGPVKALVNEVNNDVVHDKVGENSEKKDAFQFLMKSRGDTRIKTPRKGLKRLRDKSTVADDKKKSE